MLIKLNKPFLLTILYTLAVLVEGIFLYKGKLNLYGYSRFFSTFILFIFVFNRKQFKSVRLYYYIGLSFAVLADLLTIYLYENLYNIGMSLFILSYLSFATIINRYSAIKERKQVPIIIYALALLEILFITVHFLVPTLQETVNLLQIGLQVIVLILILYWSLKGISRKRGRNNYFIFSAILILFTNIVFAIDIYALSRKHPAIDALVVIFHGLYLYTLAKGVNNFKNTFSAEETIQYKKKKKYRY